MQVLQFHPGVNSYSFPCSTFILQIYEGSTVVRNTSTWKLGRRVEWDSLFEIFLESDFCFLLFLPYSSRKFQPNILGFSGTPQQFASIVHTVSFFFLTLVLLVMWSQLPYLLSLNSYHSPKQTVRSRWISSLSTACCLLFPTRPYLSLPLSSPLCLPRQFSHLYSLT